MRLISALMVILLSAQGFAGQTPNNRPSPGVYRLSTAAAAGGGASFASDNFDRANGNLGSSTSSGGGTWSRQGGADSNMTVTSNQAAPAVSAGDGPGFFINTAPASADYCVSVDVIVSGGGTENLLMVGMIDATSGWTGCRWSGDGGGRWQCYNSDYSQIGSDYAGDNPSGTSKTLKVCRVGSTLTAYVNGVSRVTGTTTYTSAGRPGFFLGFNDGGGGDTYDNFDATQ